MKTSGLLKKLGALRRRIKTLVLINAGCHFTAFAGALAATSFVLDRLFRLPVGVRAVMLLMMGGCMVWGARRFFLAPLAVPLGDDDLALLVERRHPEFKDELISAIQLERDLSNGTTQESAELIGVVVDAAVRKFDAIGFSDAVSGGTIRKPAMIGLLAVLIVGGFAVWRPAEARLWLDRCLLLRSTPWPPRTQLDVRIANADKYNRNVAEDGTVEYFIPEGSLLRIDVTATGEVPSSVQIKKYAVPREADAAPVTIDVPAQNDSNEFEYRFARVGASFEFHVTGGDDDDDDPTFRILVRSAPRINDFTVDYDFPDYINAAGQPDKRGVKEYNITGPTGTDVTMRFLTSMELEKFDLVFDDGKSGTFNPVRNPENALEYSYTTTLDADHFYTYRLIGKNGASSKDAPNFSISAQPDAPPQIVFSLPEATSMDITPAAVVFFKVQVTDDWLVGKTTLRWDPNREGAYGQTIEIEDRDQREKSEKKEVYVFKAIPASSFSIVREGKPSPLQSGDTVYVRVEATDTRSTRAAPDPNRYVYPSPVALRVREAAEIERELVRAQVRLKEEVRRALDLVTNRLREIDKARSESARRDTDQQKYANEIYALLSGHDLTTSSLSETSRAYVRVFDGYVFNRLDPTPLTESLLSAIEATHRKEEDTHYVLVTRVLPSVRNQINDGEVMGKVTRIMDMLVTAAEVTSPNVGKKLKSATEAAGAAAVKSALDESFAAADVLRTDLEALLEKMEEWEDFQDMVQSLKDIIDLEKNLGDRMKKVIR